MRENKKEREMLAQIIEQQNLGCTLQEQLDSVFKDFMLRADQFFDNQHWRNEFKQMLVSAVIGCDGDLVLIRMFLFGKLSMIY